MRGMAMVLLMLTLSGCVTIPMEYRYYSHQTKSLFPDLMHDRQMCLYQMQDRAKASGRKVPYGRSFDWDAMDTCLRESGWKRMSVSGTSGAQR